MAKKKKGKGRGKGKEEGRKEGKGKGKGTGKEAKSKKKKKNASAPVAKKKAAVAKTKSVPAKKKSAPKKKAPAQKKRSSRGKAEAVSASAVRVFQVRQGRIGVTRDADAVDEGFAEYACEACGAEAFDGAVNWIHPNALESLEGFDELAAAVGKEAQKRLVVCSACGGKASLRCFHLHTRVPAVGGDLVFRWSPDVGSQRFWFDGEHGDVPAEPTLEQVRSCLAEAGRRHLEMVSMTGDAAARREAFLWALGRELDQGQELAGVLIQSPHELSLARNELTRRLEKDATDAAAWLGLAILTVHAVHAGWEQSGGLEPPGPGGTNDAGGLTAALEQLERALAVARAHRVALRLRAVVLRFLRRPDEARAAYEALLARHPDVAPGHYDLGLILLESLGASPDPEQTAARALASFDAGARLAPEDPDYQVGRARALLHLGRLAESAEAVARARAAGSEHPALDEVEAVLERRR